MTTQQLRIRQNGNQVQLIYNGKCIEMPWQAALEVAGHIKSIAKLAEAEDAHEGLILDTAIRHRAGVPMGMSNDPRIKAEAKKEAAWNRDLRRYMPVPSVASKEVFGVPTIKQTPPKG